MQNKNKNYGRRNVIKKMAGLSVPALLGSSTSARAEDACYCSGDKYYYSSTNKTTSYHSLGHYDETVHITTSLKEEDPVMLEGHNHYTVVLNHDSISEAVNESDGSLVTNITIQTLQCTFPESSSKWVTSDDKPAYYGATNYSPGDDDYEWTDGVKDISEFLIAAAPFVGNSYSFTQLVNDLASGYSEKADDTDTIGRKWDYVGSGDGAKQRASPYLKYDAKLNPGENMYVDFSGYTTTQYPETQADINNVYISAPDATSSTLSTMSSDELNKEGFVKVTPAQAKANPGKHGLGSARRRQMIEEGRNAYIARGWGLRKKKKDNRARQPDKVVKSDKQEN